MIIFGKKTTEIHSKTAEGHCGNCGHTQQQIHFFQNYFHIFWIPVIPLSKTAALQCQNCLHTVIEKDFSSQEKNTVSRIRSDAKTPAYMFVGTALMVLLFGFVFYQIKQEEAQTLTYIAAPMTGDIAILQNNKEEFHIVKLSTIVDDTIVFQPGNYVYERLSAAKRALIKNEVKNGSYFLDDFYEMSKSNYDQALVKFVSRDN